LWVEQTFLSVPHGQNVRATLSATLATRQFISPS
jgi:hypothetical protein